MTTYFSATTRGFYPDAFKSDYDAAGTWPADAIEVTDAQWKEYTGAAPDGKQLGSDSSGAPVWVDIPSLPSDVLYEQELNEINSDYEKDISDLVLKYSRAGLFDDGTEASKKAELFSALQARQTKYTSDLNELDIKYGA
ncbi:tail fiber assembly protein [Kosakonia radicincitans]|uniref:tail fiber assembly protein n=1 Tax=Kosakonia radicincitans TaxID=283686 RepID=UPI0009A7B83F|nr:tail fiber assembly protein [Kosakonia radicincitans]